MALEGFLQEFGLADILQLIYFQKKTGVLNIEGQDKVKFYFIEGNITGVESKSMAEDRRLGRILVKKGLISQKDLLSALERQRKEHFKLGRFFVQEGLVSKEAIQEAIQDQVTETIVHILTWKEGRYEFIPGDIQPDSELSVSFDTQHLLMGGVRIVDELSVIDGKLDLDTVYKKIKEPQQEQLSDVEREVLRLIDGDSDVSTIINISPFGELETSNAIISLEEKGIIGLISKETPKEERVIPAFWSRIPFYVIIIMVIMIILTFIMKGNIDAFRVFKRTGDSIRIERLKMKIDMYKVVKGRYPERLDLLGEEKDSWGRPYIYRLEPEGFILFSAGPDNIPGTDDDVY